jgi:hypothetical protein
MFVPIFLEVRMVGSLEDVDFSKLAVTGRDAQGNFGIFEFVISKDLFENTR